MPDVPITTERDTHEAKVRDVLATYDRCRQLEDDCERLRHSLDLARQKLEHLSTDLARATFERDHYLAQVVAFREKFAQLKELSILSARLVAQMMDDSTARQAKIENGQ
jgi:hypothetical protein